MIKTRTRLAALAGVALGALALVPTVSHASSHMDAPLITLDPAANTTDVYAFVTQKSGVKYLTAALSVYPFEDPGIGPNRYAFDPNVTYQILISTGNDLAAGRPTYRYRFQFRNVTKNPNTIAQAFGGTIEAVDDANQNLTQHYTVTRFAQTSTVLFSDAIVPPNNQGLVTKYYNQGDSGENPAREGVADPLLLDRYTAGGIFTSNSGYSVFAGQRDDGFYADIQSIFDLDFSFSGSNKPFDSQGGFNVHTMVINIPLSELGGDQQVVGVWASTYRRQISVLRTNADPREQGNLVQVGRQGNPLFNEAFVPVRSKDVYSRVSPAADNAQFKTFALNPELAILLSAPESLRTNRTDLAGIFIPDMIKVDLSTGPARLAGGASLGAAPDDVGFNRLGIFGGDTLVSTVQAGFGSGTVPGGWPNGRRFGDDVLDIAVTALLSDLRTTPPTLYDPDGMGPMTTADVNIDKITHNDIGYNKVFPYAATPLNGRNHPHHGDVNTPPTP